MFIAAIVVSVLLALVLLVSARGKLVRDPDIMKTMTRVEFPENRLWFLASAEIAGAVGLVVGLFWPPLGIAAAGGVIAYFVGAVGAHLRVRDWQISMPTTLLVAGVAALVLRLLSS